MSDSEPPPSSEPPLEETRLTPLRLSPVFRNRVRLEWTDSQGPHSQIIEGKVILGSAPGSGVLVQDPTVSRVHAELSAKDGSLWIRDLESRNGTFVEMLQVTGARVPDKGRIRVGSVELVARYELAQQRQVEIWPTSSFGRLVGSSVPMRELFATLARIAPLESPVLIHGETGTGKELVAQAIHDASPRAKKPFVVVDCAALPENLLESELFGHARGAFTGAVAPRMGAIESAAGGTVFLDEIGELPIAMQPKLLRVFESRTVRRVGESTHRHVDVRFICATHRDLSRMVGSGEFREDLFFRLSVIPVVVPPLRQRKDDIERLVNHFLAAMGEKGSVDPQLLRELIDRPWRGNVRELRNFVDRARALGPKEALALADSSGQRVVQPASAPAPAPPSPDDEGAMFDAAYKEFREAWIDRGEREYVRRLLLRHDRNVVSAARQAGVDRTYIYRLIRKHEL